MMCVLGLSAAIQQAPVASILFVAITCHNVIVAHRHVVR